LRADAPVIDHGVREVPPGESQADVDGNPRISGFASDLGADEFINHRPTAAFTPSRDAIKVNGTVVFNASASRDPDPADVIRRFKWDFGDGQTALTDTPLVSHKYVSPGSFTVTLLVADLHAYGSDPDQHSLAVNVPPPAKKHKKHRGKGASSHA
jgi:PKD repeat protein